MLRLYNRTNKKTPPTTLLLQGVFDMHRVTIWPQANRAG
jgi:hypothetical protein